MIYVSDKAKQKVSKLMEEAKIPEKDYFLRVSVVGGGCSGLSYKMDFDNEKNQWTRSLMITVLKW